MTIKEVEIQVGKKISDALKELKEPNVLPDGYRCLARICGESRKKRQSASFEKSWSPDSDSITVTFVPTLEESQANVQQPMTTPPVTSENATPKSSGTTDRMSDLIKALDHAESQPGYNFVALKWFRDTALPSEGFTWASFDSIREILREAIDKRMVLTSKVPNPRSPQFPVTAIRLNRLMPEVKAILGTGDDSLVGFQPIAIRGEPLSATVLRERR